jgi:hypothetical protein
MAHAGRSYGRNPEEDFFFLSHAPYRGDIVVVPPYYALVVNCPGFDPPLLGPLHHVGDNRALIKRQGEAHYEVGPVKAEHEFVPPEIGALPEHAYGFLHHRVDAEFAAVLLGDGLGTGLAAVDHEEPLPRESAFLPQAHYLVLHYFVISSLRGPADYYPHSHCLRHPYRDV